MVFTPDASRALVIAVVVVITSAMFLASRMSPPYDIASFVVVVSLTLTVVTSLFLAVSVDPGVIPPIAHHSAEGIGREPTAPLVVDLTTGHPSPLLPQATTMVQVKSAVVECKMCPTCNIIRPPRSSHCKECNWCVRDFDHHCGVLGSCVAKRTFRYFILFLYSISALELYIGIRVIVTLAVTGGGILASNGSSGSHHDSQSNMRSSWQAALGIATLVFSACGACLTLPLAVMNTELMCENRLQKESVRRVAYRDRENRIVENPFDEGCAANTASRCCDP